VILRNLPFFARIVDFVLLLKTRSDEPTILATFLAITSYWSFIMCANTQIIVYLPVVISSVYVVSIFFLDDSIETATLALFVHVYVLPLVFLCVWFIWISYILPIMIVCRFIASWFVGDYDRAPIFEVVFIVVVGWINGIVWAEGFYRLLVDVIANAASDVSWISCFTETYGFALTY